MRGRLRGLLCCILVLVSGFLSYQAQEIMHLPDKQSVVVCEPLKLEFPAPLQKTLKSKVYGNDNLTSKYKEFDSDPTSFPAVTDPGRYQVRLSLFGLIPVRDMVVSVVPQVKVVPGGQSIGVRIRSHG